MTPSRYPGLDGLRGLAAFAVILHHTAVKGTDIGGLSVFMFFALSGFLVTGILVRARRAIEAGETTRLAALKHFWLQRALRIFPAYYAWLLIFLPFDALLFGGQTMAHLAWYLLYAQNFLIGFVTLAWQDFTHTWSLAVEQQYYVFFAPLVLFVQERRRDAFFLAAAAICLCALAALDAFGYGAITLYPFPATGFIFMATGALLVPRAGPRLQLFAHPAIVAAALAALALYPIAERGRLLHLPYALQIAASALSVGVLLAATLAAPRSRAVRALETPALTYLGRISYALYIVHLPLAYWAQETSVLAVFGAPQGFAHDLAEFFFVAPVSLVLAAVSWRWIETPFLSLKTRLKGERGGEARGPLPPCPSLR